MAISQKRTALIFALLSLITMPAAFANGDTHKAKPVSTPQVAKQKQLWNLKNVDIRTVISQVSKEIGKNIVIDPRVQGEVTLISNHPLSPDELYQVFLSILRVHGYTAVKQGKLLKVIPDIDSRAAAHPVVTHSGFSDSDRHIVRVLHVRHVPVKELYVALKPLVDKTSYITSYMPSNDLIISDTAANVRRIMDIVKELDRATTAETEMIRLRHASASELVQTLQSLESSQHRQMRNLTLAADERTNSILMSGAPSRRLRLRALIRRMDIPSQHTNIDTQVIYLKYIRAVDIAPIIANIVDSYEAAHHEPGNIINPQRVASLRRNTSSSARNGNRRGANGLNGLNRANRANGANRRNGNGSARANGNGGGRLNGLNQLQNSRDAETAVKSGSVGLAVQWEETTNAVIVKAPPTVMRTVRSVINKLDIRRPQVLVETIIAEVAVSRLRDLGVEWNGAGDLRLGTRFPAPENGVSTIKGPLGGSGSILNTPNSFLPGTGLSLGLFKQGNIRALLRALAGDSASNILSTPNVVTLDNEEATIKVGELVPFAVGQTNNDDRGGNPFTSFEREEVGLTLTIRPQITQSGAIKMEITHILSNVIPGTRNPGTGGNPTTSERIITTNVMVDDGSILVLGGLIQDDWADTVQKVPVLGNLPIVGAFFRSTSKSQVKKNLMIFLRPLILRDGMSGMMVSGGKYNYIRQQQLDARRALHKSFPDEPAVMPQLGGLRTLPQPF